MPEDVRQLLLETIEASLEAQLAAVRRLRRGGAPASDPATPKAKRSRSQLGMIEDVLRDAGQPLHVSEIIAAVQKRFGFKLVRESVVSSLVKRVHEEDRFMRSAPNTFGLLNSPARKESN